MSSTVHHPVFARIYARLSASAKGAAEHREELLAGLEGRVVEVGAGNGLNFAHYPPTVSSIRRFHFAPDLLTKQAAPKILGSARVSDA